MEKMYCTAVVLAAGRGKRMGADVPKQYLCLAGKPVLYYSLKTFQDSGIIDQIILVTAQGEETFCRENFLDKYHLTKIKQIVIGGEERCHSVWNALQAISEEGYVFIHDGARPFVDSGMITRIYEAVQKEKACVAAMPVKDTIKIAGDNGFVVETPDRSRLWMIQTPQAFDTKLIKNAYMMLMREFYIRVTDDAMVVEKMTGTRVKLVKGSYKNIKITTPEDLEIGEVFARHLNKEKSAEPGNMVE